MTSENIIATIVLDGSNNLTAVLTLTPSSEPNDDPNNTEFIENYRESDHQDLFTHSGSLSSLQINISQDQNLLDINTLAKRYKEDPTSQLRTKEVKEAFLALFSAEQRLPLAAVLEFSDLFPPSWSLTETQNINLKIGLETQFILDGVHSLLDVISSKNEEPYKSNISLSSEVEDTLQKALPIFENKNITFSNNIQPKIGKLICIKGVQFKPIFQNVLLNAIQQNNPGNNIQINCETFNLNHVRIQLRGKGTVQSYSLSKRFLFQKAKLFKQIDMDTYTLKGSGIELIIANKLIEYIGGGFSVDFKDDSVLSFDLVLPITDYIPTAPPEKISAVFQQRPTKTRNILYIEDNPTHILLVGNILKRLPGLALSSALTSKLGLELAESTKPDLILLDIRLPDINGYDVFSQLRANPNTKHIPIIALSAAAMPHEVNRALDLGFEHYLTKPFKMNEFIATVNRVLAQVNS